MAVHEMREKFDLKILEKVGNQTHTNCDYTKEQLNVIIDRIEVLKSPGNGLKKSNADFRMLKRFDIQYYSLNGLKLKNLSKREHI